MISAAFLTASASAQLLWDADGSTPGAQGGIGNWLTSNGGSPWWNGSTNVPWTDGSSAVLGGVAVPTTIVTGGIIVDDITFDSSYTLGFTTDSAPITLGMGDGVHVITCNAEFGGINPRLEGTEGLVKEGAGTLLLNVGGVYSGPTLINAGTLSARLLTSGAVTIAHGATYKALVQSSIGSLAGAGSVDTGASGTLTIGSNNSSTTFSGTIQGNRLINQDPGGSVVKAGSGIFTLTGVNTYQGSTTVTAGTLELSVTDSISQSSEVKIAADATLRLSADQSIQNLSGTGAIDLGAYTLSFKDKTMISGFTTGGSFAGTISGTGDLHIGDASNLTLSGNNSFSGGLTIGGASTVTVPIFGNAGENSPLGPGPLTLGDLSGTGAVFYSGASDTTSDRPITIATGGAHLAATSSTAELTLSGPILGTTHMTIFGPGRVRLLGDKAFSGDIDVRGGTLRLEGNFSANTLALYAGTLETVGSSRSVGTLWLNESAAVSPGGPGLDATLNTAALNLTGGRLALDLRAAGHDRLSVTGTISLNAPVELALQLEYDPEDFVEVIRLIVNDDTDAISFLNASARFYYGSHLLQEGDIFLVTSGAFSQQFQMRYGIDGDNDVRLVAMPEPGVAGLFVAAGLGLLTLRRRKIPRDKPASA